MNHKIVLVQGAGEAEKEAFFSTQGFWECATTWYDRQKPAWKKAFLVSQYPHHQKSFFSIKKQDKPSDYSSKFCEFWLIFAANLKSRHHAKGFLHKICADHRQRAYYYRASL
jgi:hypothetical protein